jgi:hypothetical protein
MVMSLRRFSDHRSEPPEQQPKNGLALTFARVPKTASVDSPKKSYLFLLIIG